MAEAGSVAEKVKQQADIVRVVGEYVRLKKTGKDFSGLCPFHQEKTPSFTVSPIKQIFYCFGCGKGGDVYNFVMDMEKCEFPEAVKLVAEKCGISIPRPKERSEEHTSELQSQSNLVCRLLLEKKNSISRRALSGLPAKETRRASCRSATQRATRWQLNSPSNGPVLLTSAPSVGCICLSAT